MISQQLLELLRAALRSAAPSLGLRAEAIPEPELFTPRTKEHGDFSTNVALALSTRVNRKPREVAQAIADALPDASFVRKVEVAGPGFLNLFLTDDWLHAALRRVAAEQDGYGRLAPTGRRVQVEFVSANPTGPLTIGHARNAAIGDALARLFSFTGDSVEREYYFNDAGGQMDRFGASVEAWYLTLCGTETPVPEDGYHGAYVRDIAQAILDDRGPGLAALPEAERLDALRAAGAERAMLSIRETLARFGVTFDSYFSEAELAQKGEIDDAIARLREGGHVYEADGAIWFRSTAFGDDKDRPLLKSDGVHTYFAADCAYVIDKFARGFDRIVYVWGADHHGDVVRVRGAAQALGFEGERVEMVIYQFVSFVRGGEPVKMSKRAGTFISLDELIDEVGTDAARFHLLLFSNDHPMNFDIDVVKEQTLENPVYYVQYGHARIASILRKAEAEGVVLKPIDQVDLALLSTDPEVELLRTLAEVPSTIRTAAELRSPHRVAHAAQDLAGRFHRFYTDCRVVTDDAALTQARLWLSWGTKVAIGNLLGILGVSAPESMERVDG